MATIVIPGGPVLDPAGHVPVYLQLAQLLRQEIMAGRYRSGDTLPGENVLSQDYGIAPSTVRGAMKVLREEGLVRTRRGAGSIVASVPPKISIEVSPDDVVTVRMPTARERAALGIAEGVPVLSVRRLDATESLFDGSRAEVRYSRLGDPVGQAHLP